MDPILRSFADNQNLFEAVKATVLAKFQGSLAAIDDELPNEHIGQYVKAQIIGLRMVEEAFKEIAKNKTPPPISERVNNAR
jgi:hypothetical protein